MTRSDHSSSDHTEAPIEIVDYDPSWPSKFDEERRLLRPVICPWLAGPIEHIGSTAVPNMPAKPVVDVMAAVYSLEESRAAIVELAKVGYAYFPYKANVMHWFCKPSPAQRTHHLHLVPYQSRLWTQRLAFRDALRRDNQLADEYAKLKRKLALRYRNDREAYTEAKSSFIQRVLNELPIAFPET